MIFVVLGMHKSGTTLVSQILHYSGINMGDIDTQVSYDRGNKFERASTLALNMDILGLREYGIIGVKAPDKLELTEDQRARMRATIRDCNKAYPNWGFKDPRCGLTYPLWASELPEHKIIAIYRPVGEIWPRFRVDSVYRAYRNPYRAWQLMNRWYEHNSRILDYLQCTGSESLVLSYRELMVGDSEFIRLQEFVGVELDDRRRKDLYRSRSDGYPLLIKIAARLAYKRMGCTPENIEEQFEALRRT